MLNRLFLTGLFFFGVSAFGAQTFNIGNGGEPKDLDPHIVTGIPEYHILKELFEPLVNRDPKTLEPTSGVALLPPKVSKDGKVYTFALRQDAKWSNGEPVTAQDFVYSFARLLEPKTAAEYAYQGYFFVNGKEYNKGAIKDAAKLGVRAVDKYTLELTLVNPVPYLLTMLAHHSYFPVHKATVEKFGARWTRPENMVSNGAYVLAKWETNKVITIKPNPFYWDKDKVKLTEVNFWPISKQDTEEKMFRAKKLHVTEELPIEKIPFWRKDKTGSFFTHPYLGTYYFWVNVNKPPVNNKKVRQALALGFDRQRLIQYVILGGQDPSWAFTPPGIGGYEPPKYLPKDGSRVEDAKKLLAEAGFPGGKGLPPIEILFNTSDNHRKIAEALQQMWKQNLGIEVKLYNQEWKVVLENQRNKNYFLSRMGWIADYPDPNTFLEIFLTGGGNNHSGYSNKEYDKLLGEADKELDTKKRFAILQKAESILIDDMPIIPVYTYQRLYLKAPEVEGWTPNILDYHPLKFVSLKGR